MEIDPFDIEWVETDPLDREVLMLKSVKQAREFAGKHSSTEEFLSTDDVRQVVSNPDRIDFSSSNPDRDLYYEVKTEYTNQYARVVVDFRGDPSKGVAISWSRYEHPVSSHGIRYRKSER